MTEVVTELALCGWEWRDARLFGKRDAIPGWLQTTRTGRNIDDARRSDAAASDRWLLVHRQLVWPIAAVRLDATGRTSHRDFNLADDADRTSFVNGVIQQGLGAANSN